MKKNEFKKYQKMGIGIARTMQKIELFEKICEVCANEPMTAHEIAEELISNGYEYYDIDIDTYYNESYRDIRSLTSTIANFICCYDCRERRKFFEIGQTPEEAILVTDGWTNETYAVKTSVHTYKFIG